MALTLNQTQDAAALMQVEEGTVRAMNEAKLLRVSGGICRIGAPSSEV